MPKLSKRIALRIEVVGDDQTLITRDVEVRSQADLEIAIADTLRQHRLAEDMSQPLWEFSINVSKLVQRETYLN